MKHFVYGLFDACSPSKIMYVGLTKSLALRLWSHERGKSPALRDWLIQVENRDSCMGIKVLQVCRTKKAGLIAEQMWIGKIKGLLNRKGNDVFQVSGIQRLQDVENTYVAWAVKILGKKKVAGAIGLTVRNRKMHKRILS